MRVTVSHNKPVDQVKKSVDRSLDDLFRNPSGIPLKIENVQRSWQGSTLTFSFTAKMGIISSPMKGIVEVTPADLTIDVDLGLLERLLPQAKARASLEDRIKGLLT